LISVIAGPRNHGRPRKIRYFRGRLFLGTEPHRAEIGQNLKTPLELRSEVIAIRERWYRREVTMEEVHAVVDEYIAAVVRRAKELGRKNFRAPTRSYVLRAL